MARKLLVAMRMDAGYERADHSGRRDPEARASRHSRSEPRKWRLTAPSSRDVL